MSELGITDFDTFDFISPPQKEDIRGAVETLNQMGALNEDNTLSSIGKIMVEFPLEPRVSRILVESIMRYPDVLEEAVIAASFMSTHSPFVLPPGEESDARKAHHAFRDIQGDFVSYVKLFRTYESMKNPVRFCQNNYLDERVMAEISNIKSQLEDEIGHLGIPIGSGGSMDDYLCCIASGMIQFVCVREGKENYRSLTADHISIHPGSSMFRTDPLFIVAGEIVRTSRTFAMSVSPLTKSLLSKISPDLEAKLNSMRGKRGRSLTGNLEFKGSTFASVKGKLLGRDDGHCGGKKAKEKNENEITIGGEIFEIKKQKGKKLLILPLNNFKSALQNDHDENKMAVYAPIRSKIILHGTGLLSGEKLELVSKVVKTLNLNPIGEKDWNKRNFDIHEEGVSERLIGDLNKILRITLSKKNKEYAFLALFTDGRGTYWFKMSRGFATALNESLSSLETLVDENIDFSVDGKERINEVYRMLNSLYD